MVHWGYFPSTICAVAQLRASSRLGQRERMIGSAYSCCAVHITCGLRERGREGEREKEREEEGEREGEGEGEGGTERMREGDRERGRQREGVIGHQSE
mmetsp:Transcript_1928/g.3960  ORF Transcript_1928/g.3960 Transcript_1928/m.3960 type:complete len:98 (+) Transcript_1928:297-590(+)